VNDAQPLVLLVDDDADVHAAVRLILEPMGWRLTSVTTEPAARAVLFAEKPDIILLDIMLATPTEGLELALAIRSEPAFAQRPIVMLSSISQDAAVQLGSEAGLFEAPAFGAADASPLPFDAFMQKPFDAATLMQTLQKVRLTGG
jgi:CheY-like chemotaxis protein